VKSDSHVPLMDDHTHLLAHDTRVTLGYFIDITGSTNPTTYLITAVMSIVHDRRILFTVESISTEDDDRISYHK
jgi:hypothetical protein